jgi:hypothetical protein
LIEFDSGAEIQNLKALKQLVIFKEMVREAEINLMMVVRAANRAARREGNIIQNLSYLIFNYFK